MKIFLENEAMVIFEKVPGIVQGKDDHGVFIKNENTGESARIDDAMMFVFMLCDGQKNYEQIAQDVQKYTGDKYSEVLNLVTRILQSLENLGFIRRVQHPPKQNIQQQHPQQFRGQQQYPQYPMRPQQ